jgi:hypothetical protein
MAIYSLRLLSWSAPEKFLRAKLKMAIFEHRFFATLRSARKWAMRKMRNICDCVTTVRVSVRREVSRTVKLHTKMVTRCGPILCRCVATIMDETVATLRRKWSVIFFVHVEHPHFHQFPTPLA